MTTSIRVGIVEDDDAIRDGLVAVLRTAPGLLCRHIYTCCEDAVADRREAPDVILMDIHLGDGLMNGIEGARRVKTAHPATEILMLTVFDENEKIFASLCAGASGYLLKNTPAAEIVAAVREIHAGGSPMSAIIARKVLDLFKTVAPPALPDVNLTQREREVLELLVRGMNYKIIANELFISLDTVASHVKRIYDKLHVHSKSEAVAKALKHKLV